MFRSLQRRIVIVFVGLIVLVMALVLALVAGSKDRIVESQTQRELETGVRVFELLADQNRRQLETAASVLAADFAFREAIATQDRATMRSVIANHGMRIGAQVMIVIDPEGRAIAETPSSLPQLETSALTSLRGIAESSGRASGFANMSSGALYQFVVVPVLAPKLIAWVAVGFAVDDKWAGDVAGITGLTVSVARPSASGHEIIASSLVGHARDELATVLGDLPDRAAGAVRIGNEAYQSVRRPLSGETQVVLQRSVDPAEVPLRTLQGFLWTVMLGGVALFVAGSVMLARQIARPVNELAQAAGRVEAGNYVDPVSVRTSDEIGRLAESFDRMRRVVAAREQDMHKLAFEDSLTGLANRTRFVEAFNQLPAGSRGAVVLLDLDRFALINNALGHAVGDRLLTRLGARLGVGLSGAGLAARLWGDEFAFLLQGADGGSAKTFSRVLRELLRDPVTLDGQRLDVGGSIGIAMFPDDASDCATLIRRAEAAMYAAKRRRDGVVFAAEIGDRQPHEQLSLVGEMRDAIANNEFLLFYQPKLDFESARILGAEALIRWRHPERGLIPPGRFVPFAEQTGFIQDITSWALDAAVAQAALWRDRGLALQPSINLSARDLLNPNLVAQARDVVRARNLPADALCLEITESAMMEEPELAQKNLSDLANLGFRLSIDDYGVGQASLAYLKTLPVHELKIDQTFMRDISASPKNAAIVRSTIMLCHNLNLRVVAEGVESHDDLLWLSHNECDSAQGFVIARPMPADEVPDWIAAYDIPPDLAQAGAGGNRKRIAHVG